MLPWRQGTGSDRRKRNGRGTRSKLSDWRGEAELELNSERRHDPGGARRKAQAAELHAITADIEHALRRLAAVASGLSDATPLPSTVVDVPPDTLKHGIYVAVSRGATRDSSGGQFLKANCFRGVEKTVLAHLLIRGSIHAIEVIAYQAKSGSGTIFDRRRHAETTIAKLKRAIGSLSLVIEKKGRNRRGMEWVLRREDITAVEFSVDAAVASVARAAEELHDGKPACALLAAVQAVEHDQCVQDAHEVLCRAAASCVPKEVEILEHLRKSSFFLRARVDQLIRGLQICEASLAYADDENARSDLEFYASQFREEGKRLETLITDITERFGPFDREPSKDRVANEAIAELRALNLTFEPARSHPLFAEILRHPRVEWLRDKIVKDARENSLEDRNQMRQWMNAEILKRVLDPTGTPTIRAICKATEHEIPRMLNPDSDRDTSEARDVKRLDNAEDAFFKEHGRHASMEDGDDVIELAGLMGCSPERVRDVGDSRKTRRPEQLGAAERGHQKRKKRLSGDADDDDDDDRD